jgi:LacI family repressor for deo operon, udp, cdd, tsx, nupC, and nupG
MNGKKDRDEGAGPLMRDVARAAGVATSTVSRALANPGRVNEETRVRIVEAAARLGYTPNAAARNLRVGSSTVIMIILPDDGTSMGIAHVVSTALRGVDAALTRRGYSLLIANFDRFEATDRHVLDLAFGGLVGGTMVISGSLPSADGRSVLDAGIPTVALLVDLSGQGVPSVVTNDRSAVYGATRHFIEQGHTELLYIAGPEGNYHEVERYRGFVDCLRDAGLPAEAGLRFPGDFKFQGGIDAAHAYLALERRPTAVLCCNDDMAISFMKTVRQAGLNVPGDVSVIGFDGAEVAEFCEPSLTTIVQPVYQIGEAAAQLLLERIEARTAGPALTTLDSTLVIRDSTAPPARP